MNLQLYHTANPLILWRGGLLATDSSRTMPLRRRRRRLDLHADFAVGLSCLQRRNPNQFSERMR